MALQTFGTMLSQYPNSAKAPAAQFKIGECYEKLNIPSSAREAYKRVIADYPSSEYKDRAESKLNALK
jgi:TolA-binding protein